MPQTLNFTNAASFNEAVDWVRSNVVFGKNSKGTILQLDVTFPRTQVTVFMNPKNHYILAFRGANAIYVLDDPSDSPQFIKDLQAASKNTTVTLLKGFAASHQGVAGLQTFAPGIGIRQRNFTSRDFGKLTALTQFNGTSSYDPLRKPLSLLVFMIAESARFPMLQKDFINMYMRNGAEVLADEVVQAYSKAKALRAFALSNFPNYRSPEAVAKVQNRAKQLEILLESFVKLSKNPDTRALTTTVLSGQIQTWEGGNTGNTDTFRGMCKELSLTTAAQVAELIGLCDNEMAVRAAKEGVALPGIDG